MRFTVALLLTPVLFGGGMLPMALAQTPSSRGDQRRDLVDGILRTLIDSQLNRQGQPAVRQPTPGSPTAESPQMAEVRRLLQGFSQEAVGLIAALRNEERYSPSIRPLLGEAITTKAAADILLQKSQYIREQKLLTQDMQELDQQWRFLSNRLAQIPNLGVPCKTQIGRLDAYDQQLCRLLQIAPQLDVAALINRTMALITHLENLQQDIAIDLQDVSQRDQILTDGRKLQAQLNQLADVVGRNAPRDEVVAQFKQIYDVWRVFAANLRGVDSESVARDIFRIDRIKAEIHQLLWLEQQVDPVTLVHLTKHLERNVEQVYRLVPISVLLAVPQPEKGMSSAKEFYDLCRNLSVSAGKKDSLQEMLWDFRLLEVEWQQVRAFVAPLGISGMNQSVARVDWSVDALRRRSRSSRLSTGRPWSISPRRSTRWRCRWTRICAAESGHPRNTPCSCVPNWSPGPRRFRKRPAGCTTVSPAAAGRISCGSPASTWPRTGGNWRPTSVS